MNQLYIYIYPHISSLLRLPPYPTPLGGHKHRADLPVLCGCFPLAIYFTLGSVYMSMPLSHFVPAYPSLSPCPQVHSIVSISFYSDKLHFLKSLITSKRLRQHGLQFTLFNNFNWAIHTAWKSIIFYISNLLLATFSLLTENFSHLLKYLIPICRWPWLYLFPKMMIISYPSFFSILKFLYATNHLHLFVSHLWGKENLSSLLQG